MVQGSFHSTQWRIENEITLILCRQNIFSFNDTSTELVKMCRIKVPNDFFVYFCVKILNTGQQQGL